MPNLLYALIAAILVGFISLVGVFSLFLNKNILSKIIFALVALSAGALIGGAFLHLIPEAVEKTEGLSVFIYVLVGFSLFYLI
ncbi:ZIP family metal transporter, partial [bacterium]|nr:ZIP family metal transporter [bacterium]